MTEEVTGEIKKIKKIAQPAAASWARALEPRCCSRRQDKCVSNRSKKGGGTSSGFFAHLYEAARLGFRVYGLGLGR